MAIISSDIESARTQLNQGEIVAIPTETVYGLSGNATDEQIELLRRYWQDPLFSFEGQFDRLTRGNINVRPNRQIPITRAHARTRNRE